MRGRVERLRERLEEPLLVTGPVNLRYLTGFRSSNAALLVEPGRARLFADFRYAEAGRAVPGVEFVETQRALLLDLSGRLSGRIGFEADALTYSAYETLRAGGLELVPRTGLVEGLRAVKDAGELELIRRAAAITNETYSMIAAEGLVGRTEREVALAIERLFHELGGDGPAFPVIVAAGANGARPHAESGPRPIGRGETVVIDAGAAVAGYCSDCTRTFATGPLPPELERAYAVCLRAQEDALAAACPGATGGEVDAVARGAIAAEGLGEAFGHGLGHGVGLAIHEAPTLRPDSEDVLAPGNVVTIEPGIYLEGLGGIRIEDLVVVTSGGPEVLTAFPKQLVTLD